IPGRYRAGRRHVRDGRAAREYGGRIAGRPGIDRGGRMSAGGERALEVASKLALLRDCLATSGAAAIRLRGVDWFAWVTAGGSNAVLQAGGEGVAEVLVTQEEAVVLADEIELARLREEEIPAGFTFHVAPWTQIELHESYVLGLAGERAVLSDRPHGGEQPLPA